MLLHYFEPKVYIEHFATLDLDKLQAAGIRLLVCDIDNTLVAHDEAHPTPAVFAFVQRVKESGIALYLVSNNHHERVSTFAAELDVPIYPFAKKPLKGTYRRILADSKVPANQIAALGDQLLTDVLGANRMGMLAMLTKPIAQKDLKVTKINRVLENLVFARLARKKKLIKGEYYD